MSVCHAVKYCWTDWEIYTHWLSTRTNLNLAFKNATWRWQWALPMTAIILYWFADMSVQSTNSWTYCAESPVGFFIYFWEWNWYFFLSAPQTLCTLVKFRTQSYNTFWDMNYYALWIFLYTSESVLGIYLRSTYKGFILWWSFRFVAIILSEIWIYYPVTDRQKVTHMSQPYIHTGGLNNYPFKDILKENPG